MTSDDISTKELFYSMQKQTMDTVRDFVTTTNKNIESINNTILSIDRKLDSLIDSTSTNKERINSHDKLIAETREWTFDNIEKIKSFGEDKKQFIGWVLGATVILGATGWFALQYIVSEQIIKNQDSIITNTASRVVSTIEEKYNLQINK